MTHNTKLDKIKVGLVDDHNILRQSLAKTLNLEFDMEVLGSWSRAEDAIDDFSRFPCDVYVMDLKLPGINGIEATRQLVSFDPSVKVIILSAYSDQRDVFNSIEAGVLGYLPKEATVESVVEAIRNVYRGYAFLDPAITRTVVNRFSDLEHWDRERRKLSALERNILSLAARGNSNQDIARTLSLKVGAVKFHFREIFTKLDARDRAHAVALALKKGDI